MKKRFFALLTAAIVMASGFTAYAAPKNDEKMTAVWISTIYNSNFPKSKTVEDQKAEFKTMLNKLEDHGINTIMVQVRPKADALYDSEINPWSDVIMGTQGEYPGYDPLEFMIEEAHKHNIEIHAWLNPYRITTSGTDLGALHPTHPAIKNTDWVISYNNALYYDPSNDEVKQHICDSVEEIITNYDVDGIHFDDYFYPSGYPLSDGQNKDGEEANARREDVNDLIYKVSRVIKNSSKDILFGVSPSGICLNEETGKYGSVIRGSESYYEVYADPRVWIEKEWIDYIVPQVYWETTHKTAAFETVVKWWQDQVKGTDVDLYIGHGIYKDVVAEEITTQLEILEKYSQYVDGSFFYSVGDLLDNRKGCGDAVKAYFYEEEKPEETTPPVKDPEIIELNAEAIYSKSKVFIDDHYVNFEAYNIGGYTYFKLRDVAYALTDTQSKFDIYWDPEKQMINLIIGANYTASGGELEIGEATNKNALLSTATLRLNGEEIAPMAYNINGNNFFKLRDLGEAIGFDVQWDETNKTIVIFTE